MNDTEALFRKAVDCHIHGRLTDAVALYGDVIRSNPHVAAAHCNLAIVLQSLNRPDDALMSYERAIELQPGNADTHYNKAVALTQLGRFEDAVRSYDDALKLKPDHMPAHNNKGSALKSLNRLSEALACFDEAIGLQPAYPEAHYNRANVLRDLGRLEEALHGLDMTIELKPDYAEAYTSKATMLRQLGRGDDALQCANTAIALAPQLAEAYWARGNLLQDAGRLHQALEDYEQAIALNPAVARAHHSKGNVLQRLNRPQEAVRCFECAIALNPLSAEAHYDRANALKDLGQWLEAVRAFDRAIAIRLDYADAYNDKGNVLQRLDRPLGAIESYERAIALRPDYAQAYSNRGNVLKDLGRLDEALESFETAIELEPGLAEVYNNRGNVLKLLKRFDEAFESFDRATALKANFADAYLNKATCTLLTGNCGEGWPLYEWRKTVAEATEYRSFPQPGWAGTQSLEGKALYVYAEQGLGDAIQFCRYALLARAKGARVILAVQQRMKRLVESLGQGIEVVALTTPLPAFDYHAALMSMPLAFGTTHDRCPAPVPYLRAEPERVEMWKRRIGPEGFKIGICWQGNKRARIDVGRSFPLRLFEAIGEVPSVRLISLQKYDGVEQLSDLPSAMRVETLGDEFDAGPDAFLDTAAVMECLDLVIASDTAIVHLAGALGRPVWVALKHVPDWRWLLDRTDSPWYPTMQLFRQPERDDWPSVFAAMRAQLSEELAANKTPPEDDAMLLAKADKHRDQGRFADALRLYDGIIRVNANLTAAHFNRANTLQSLERFAEAVRGYDQAIVLEPDNALAHYNRAAALRRLDRLDEALQNYNRAIALEPEFAEAHNNRGNTLKDLKRMQEAVQSYERAIALNPGSASAHWNKGICKLLAGDFETGWPLFEWRKANFKPAVARKHSQPLWSGAESLNGKTLFVYAEHGLGDTIQFSRYAVLAREQGAKVIFAVQDPLIRLLKGLSPEIEVQGLTRAPRTLDHHIALLSMPLAFGTNERNCPAEVPYLRAEADLVARWRQRLDGNEFKIGICWQGNKRADIDIGRSFSLRHLEGLAKLPNVRLISLQKYDGVAQLRGLPSGMSVDVLERLDAGSSAFIDTAAVMECLDLVITSDTAIAHLAGALGRPAWVALKYVPDWRWLLDRADSPWYPTLKLFRQAKPGDWPSVFSAMQAELAGQIG